MTADNECPCHEASIGAIKMNLSARSEALAIESKQDLSMDVQYRLLPAHIMTNRVVNWTASTLRVWTASLLVTLGALDSMSGKFHFTFESDWRSVPGAFWVHLPDARKPGIFAPSAPLAIPHKGYPVLHVEFEGCDLLFSSAAQLDHYIDVLSRTALPTSRQLSEASGLKAGPNQHWLSRLPAELKSPKKRHALVRALSAARVFAADNAPNIAFKPDVLKRAG